ncbi:hypothetical protein SAMN06295879_0773 [Agreia bicolorata]|uniref:Uncharacterized protein n=1 Tax=Agreia bicolorata TaxID=110935 RepID=A0A1T4X793_9MICO|nr:hypothetical protein [Agreia bicolorata]KJC65417.1 hypothetical protein TZ00_00595 [Agreia bicolorata]SKA85540.1 hypothetical protein SAMN06295879_0773 [Agreia bicolorata]
MNDAYAVAELMRWAAENTAHLTWQQIGEQSIEFDVAAPYSVLLTAVSGTWHLETVSGRGIRTSSLGGIETPFGDVLETLRDRLYSTATDEFDDADRAGSQALAQVLRTSSDEHRDRVWCARAATLLAGHAIKDGYGLQARLRLEEAAALYAAAGDVESESRMLQTLASLPELLQA